MKRALAFIALVSGLCTLQSAAATAWRVVEPDSHIGFTATYDGIPFEARFNSFDVRVRFDPADLQESSLDVRIDTASVDSNSRDRDRGMQDREWFAVERHPLARFRADRIESLSGDRYRAVGELTVKGITRSIEVPFRWRRLSDGDAVLTAEVTVDRRNFDIGTGEWAEDDTIGFEVIVDAQLKLRRPSE